MRDGRDRLEDLRRSADDLPMINDPSVSRAHFLSGKLRGGSMQANTSLCSLSLSLSQ